MSSLRRLLSSAPVPVPVPTDPHEDDNLLSEILLRLPADPSSLPRASLVCKRWLHLISDPAFFSRFRVHHRDNLPLLGFFLQEEHGISFEPTVDPPNRVADGRFSLRFDEADRPFVLLSSRHGLVLVYLTRKRQLLVWDPFTGDRHHLALPPVFDNMNNNHINGAVLRAAGDVHFQVVLVVPDKQYTRVFACVYSSKTGLWGNLISTPLPSVSPFLAIMYVDFPAVLVGNSLYWLPPTDSLCVLEFDLDRQSLAVLTVPVDMHEEGICNFTVMRAEGGGLGFLFLSASCAQFWKRTIDCNGVASWVLGRTIGLDKLLSLNLEEAYHGVFVGLAEDNNTVFLLINNDFLIVQLDSMQSKKLFRSISMYQRCHAFESVYTAGIRIGGGHDGAELLHNA